MSSSAKFWNRVAGPREINAEVTGGSSLKTLELCQPYLKGDSRLLDFGCGNGKLSLALSNAVREVVAIDTAERMINNANHLKNVSGVENISFEIKPITDENLDRGSFDVITTFSVLHYVFDLPELMARVSVLLKPGGYFVSTTPCLRGKRNAVSILTSLASRIRLIPPMRRYNVNQLAELIVCAGKFEIVESSELSDLPECFIVARKVNS